MEMNRLKESGLRIKVILAHDNKFGIGKDNQLPWMLKSELKNFRDITSHTNTPLVKNVIIMGRKTWESLPVKPLPNRMNVVISGTITEARGATVFKSLPEALTELGKSSLVNKNNIFIIGGEMLFTEAINSPLCEKAYITEIYKTFDCDKKFQKLPDNFKITNVSKIKEENGIHYRYFTYSNKEYYGRDFKNEYIYENLEEKQYLDTLRNLIMLGQTRIDRTQVGTYSLFGIMHKYDLSRGFPLLTTKRMFVRGIFEELMFYLSGKTDNTILTDKGIHVWDGNTTRDFLDKRGLTHLPEGDLGETYGFNFRHFGGTYNDCKTEYPESCGFDQVANAINLIRHNPASRRIIIDIWNGATQDNAALPPCLCKYQFYVNDEEKKLDLMIYLRSSDFFLANNWNVATGSFLVHLICNLTGIDLNPGTLTAVMADTHLYQNHIEQARTNLQRETRPYPILKIKEKKDNIMDFTYDDLELIGYKPHPNIKATMAV